MNYFQGPPPEGATLYELKQYLRTPKFDERMPSQNIRTKPNTSSFQKKYKVNPRDFLREAMDDDQWTEEGQKALEDAWQGNVDDEILDALGHAYYNREHSEVSSRVPSPFVKQRSSQERSGPKESNWWRSVKIPKITSAENSSKE